MATKKRTAGRKRVRRRDRFQLSLRLPREVVVELEAMAREVGMSRNALITLMLRQAVELHKATVSQPELFSGTEALLEASLRRAFGRDD